MVKSEYSQLPLEKSKGYKEKCLILLVQAAKFLPMSEYALQRAEEVFEGDTVILVHTCWSGCPGHCADCIWSEEDVYIIVNKMCNLAQYYMGCLQSFDARESVLHSVVFDIVYNEVMCTLYIVHCTLHIAQSCWVISTLVEQCTLHKFALCPIVRAVHCSQ